MRYVVLGERADGEMRLLEVPHQGKLLVKILCGAAGADLAPGERAEQVNAIDLLEMVEKAGGAGVMLVHRGEETPVILSDLRFCVAALCGELVDLALCTGVIPTRQLGHQLGRAFVHAGIVLAEHKPVEGALTYAGRFVTGEFPVVGNFELWPEALRMLARKNAQLLLNLGSDRELLIPAAGVAELCSQYWQPES